MDVVVFDEGDGVETDLIHQLTGEGAIPEHVFPEQVDFARVADTFRENLHNFALDCCPQAVEDEPTQFSSQFDVLYLVLFLEEYIPGRFTSSCHW